MKETKKCDPWNLKKCDTVVTESHCNCKGKIKVDWIFTLSGNNNKSGPVSNPRKCQCQCQSEEINEKKDLTCKRYGGLFFALLAAFFFSLVPLITKLVDRIHPLGQTVWRQVVSMTISLTLLTVLLVRKGKSGQSVFKHVIILKPLIVQLETLEQKRRSTLDWKCLGMITLAASMTSTGALFRVTAYEFLSIADATVLTYMSLIFIPIFAHFFLSEKCQVVPALMAVLIICGVCIIAKPPFLTGASGFDSKLGIGLAIKLADAFILSIYSILLRKLRHIHSALMNLSVAIVGFIIALIAALAFQVIQVPHGTYEVSLLIALGFTQNFAHLSLILALTFEHAGPVSLLRTLDVPLVFLWQILVLNSSPDIWTILGSIIVVMAVLVTSLRKWVQELPEESNAKRRLSFLLV